VSPPSHSGLQGSARSGAAPGLCISAIFSAYPRRPMRHLSAKSSVQAAPGPWIWEIRAGNKPLAWPRRPGGLALVAFFPPLAGWPRPCGARRRGGRELLMASLPPSAWHRLHPTQAHERPCPCPLPDGDSEGSEAGGAHVTPGPLPAHSELRGSRPGPRMLGTGRHAGPTAEQPLTLTVVGCAESLGPEAATGEAQCEVRVSWRLG
jgi:hypothetical protein